MQAPQSDPCQSGTASLQRLTQFARDMGHPTSLPVIAERILSGLSEVSRHSQGVLYLLDRERERFCQVVVPTPTPLIAAPPVVPLNHPLVQQLAHRQDILDSSVLADSLCTASLDNTTDAQFATLPIDLAIPLLNRGRLIAFVLFQSQDRILGHPLPYHGTTGRYGPECRQCARLSPAV